MAVLIDAGILIEAEGRRDEVISGAVDTAAMADALAEVRLPGSAGSPT